VQNRDLEKQIEFILELEKLKSVLRKVKPVGETRYENSAEHSWQICLLAMILAPYANEVIDLDKVIKMLLVHDIAEIDTGDLIAFAKIDGIDEEEEKAINRIFGILPEHQRDSLISLCREFGENQTSEAKFANAMDRFMPVLQNLVNNGQSWRENNISREQVLKKASMIGFGSQFLWDQMSQKIKEFDF
jgi:putative hydrolase of HD superfamily